MRELIERLETLVESSNTFDSYSVFKNESSKWGKTAHKLQVDIHVEVLELIDELHEQERRYSRVGQVKLTRIKDRFLKIVKPIIDLLKVNKSKLNN